MKNVAERLVKARGEEPRAVVCAAVGISASALRMYETGRRIPRDNIKVKLAEDFKTDVQTLFY